MGEINLVGRSGGMAEGRVWRSDKYGSGVREEEERQRERDVV